MPNHGDDQKRGEAIEHGATAAALSSIISLTMPHPGFAAVNAEVTEIPVAEVTIPSALAFVEHWESLRDGRMAPSWREFDLLSLGTEPVSRMMVVDVLKDPLRFKYRFWGTANVKVKGVEMTGRYLEAFPEPRAAVAVEEYHRVISERRPMAFQDRLVLPDSFGSRISTRAALDQITVRLPLSDDGSQVDHVISLANWERFGPS